MSIVARMVIGAVGFFILYASIGLVSLKVIPSKNGFSAGRRLPVAAISIVIELALAAWFGRWLG
jgi:hypothetical protein